MKEITKEIVIREMTWDDLDQVVAIENENFSVPWTETGFFTYLMRSDALFLVAAEALDPEELESEEPESEESESEALDPENLETEEFETEENAERILGYCGIIMAADEGDITNVSVKKDLQGQGIGTMLIQELVSQTEKMGIQTIFLEVRKSNAAALALYEKQGFERMGVRKNYYTDPTEDAITMSRKLSH